MFKQTWLTRIHLQSDNQPLHSMQRKFAGIRGVLRLRRLIFLACTVFLICMSPVLSSDNQVWIIKSNNIAQGEAITVINNAGSPEVKTIPSLILKPQDGSGLITLQAVGPIAKSDKPVGIVFSTLQNKDLGPGKYEPILSLPVENATPKEVRIGVQGSLDGKLDISRSPGELVINSISPPGILFPAMNGHYSFAVNGDGFSPIGSANKLIIAASDADEGKIQDVCWSSVGQGDQSKVKKDFEKCKEQLTKAKKPYSIGKLVDTRHLQFDNVTLSTINSGFRENLGIRIGIDNNLSQFKPLTISRVAYPIPLILSAGIVSALTAASWWIIAKGTNKNLVHWLLLDKETNTYSLSRFQFYLWTLVAILSYFFLLFSRNLAQGKLEFIDIPSGLPGIVFISAATSFFAIGITETKGSKGSGFIKPRLSDFITAGGNVVPERFQFAIWSIVGVLVYVFIVLFQNPGVIDKLPTIPDGFLQLSGVSSLGYLGGKLARMPGPLTNSIGKAQYSNGSLALTIHGNNLSSNASFELFTNSSNGQPIKLPKDISINTPGDKEDPKKATITIKEAEPASPNLATVLDVKIPSATNLWPYQEQMPYKLVIYNPDGQFAEWKFDGTKSTLRPTITSIVTLPIKINTKADLTIIGTDFTDQSKVVIQFGDPAAPSIPPLKPTKITTTKIEVSFQCPATTDTKATLVISNPDGTSSLPSQLTFTT
jgi:hypothetical protein